MEMIGHLSLAMFSLPIFSYQLLDKILLFLSFPL